MREVANYISKMVDEIDNNANFLLLKLICKSYRFLSMLFPLNKKLNYAQ